MAKKLKAVRFRKFDDPKIRTFKAVDLYRIANWHESEIENPDRTDDTRWLVRHEQKIRAHADKKRDAFLHKLAQKGIHY